MSTTPANQTKSELLAKFANELNTCPPGGSIYLPRGLDLDDVMRTMNVAYYRRETLLLDAAREVSAAD